MPAVENISFSGGGYEPTKFQTGLALRVKHWRLPFRVRRLRSLPLNICARPDSLPSSNRITC
jgi:hypothetical protein